MFRVVLSPDAQEEFSALDASAKILFAKHLAKIEISPPRKRLLGSSNYAVENVGQGRIICKIAGEEIMVMHIFPTHKEYETWFRRLK